MEADSEVADPTVADDSAPDDLDAADLGEVDLDVADSALTVAAVHRHLAGLPVVDRRLVCFLRPALPGWVYRFAHWAQAASQAAAGGLGNGPEGAAEAPAAPPLQNTRQCLESSAR